MTKNYVNKISFGLNNYLTLTQCSICVLGKNKLMKKSILILSTLALVACGEEKSSVSADMPYEDRVIDVCDCFMLAPESNDCYMLQADHMKHVGADKVMDFSRDIGECKSN